MLDNANRMEEGTRRINPMGMMHAIGRDSPFHRSVCHEGISIKLKPCLNPLAPVTSLEPDSVHSQHAAEAPGCVHRV